MSSLRYVLVLVQDLTPEKKLLHLGKQYQRELEERVKTRTAELKITNAALRSEVEQRRKVQEALKESEQRYRALFDHCPVALWVEDASQVKQYLETGAKKETEGEIPIKGLQDEGIQVKLLEANQELQKLLGVEGRNGDLSRLQEYYRKTSLYSDPNKLMALANGKTTFEGELSFENNQGAQIHAALKWSVLPGYEKSYSRLLVSIMDITERKLAEDRIRKSLKEKEALLREIHHRVKNNLQVVSSLLRLQSTYVTEQDTVRMFIDTEQRVRSMALAHEQLYQSDDLSELDLQKYLSRLIETLVGSSETIGRKISVTTDIQPLQSSLETALPLGCIVTELFSNCMKHAFPNSMEGEIRISLAQKSDGSIELIVKDNGVGLKKQVDLNKPGSLGMDLIGAFTDQLHGAIDFESVQGTRIMLIFRDIPARKGRRANGRS
jgi:two-component sensor histidine kinase